METTLGSISLIKSEKEVIKNIKRIEKKYKKLIAWLQGSPNINKTTETEIIKNILISTHNYLRYIETGAYKEIQLLALGVRSALENLVRYRFIMQNDENLKKWVSESAADYKSIIKGFSSLGDASSKNIKFFEKELIRIDQLHKKYEYPEVKQPQQIKTMAEVAGLIKDYDTIFKVTSKLIHPSSLYINSSASLDNHTYHNILVIHGQLYSLMMYKEICDNLSVPKEISDFS
ncbi:DUF5677 domain-containing protein [Aeromonas veronii]